MEVHASGWDLELLNHGGRECLRVWFLGDHIADCHTLAEVLRVVPLKVFVVMITADQEKRT